jgi:hypothetical protein
MGLFGSRARANMDLIAATAADAGGALGALLDTSPLCASAAPLANGQVAQLDFVRAHNEVLMWPLIGVHIRSHCRHHILLVGAEKRVGEQRFRGLVA